MDTLLAAIEQFTVIEGAGAAAIVACLIGGLGIFLLGMQQISEGLQGVAGPRMRKVVAAATTNRFAGVATGTIVTAIIQSSSVTTVMVVGMVTSGIMTLLQAINVIIGANIGTTVTAWLVAVFPKVGITAIMSIIGVAAILYLFATRERWKFIGLILLGLGLIFFGLELMSGALSPISESQGMRDAMALFSATGADGTFSVIGMLKCILVGAVATAIVQSSSATTGIAIILVANGAIDFNTAACLVLGMNIGTTVTAWLAALKAPTNARRAALAHSLFNVIGVLIMAPLFPFVLPLAVRIFHIDTMGPEQLTFAVAGVHTAFNAINTCIFLPFTRPYAWLIEHIIPDPKVRELPRLALLNPLKVAPVVAVEQARKEVEHMADRCGQLLDDFRLVLAGKTNETLENDIFHREEELDVIQHEVSAFLGQIMSTNLPADVAYRSRMLLRVADEYESVSDEVAALLKQFIRIRRSKMKLSDRGRQALLGLHDLCASFAATVTESFLQGKAYASDVLADMYPDAAGISARVKEIRKDQMLRLAEHDPTIDPLCVVIVLDVLNIYRRLKEDCLNIGEAMLDEAR